MDLPNKIVTLLIAGIFIGCASPGLTPPTAQVPAQEQTRPAPAVEALTDNRRIVVYHANKNIGTHYAWGGSSPSTGFDCSGLVVYTHGKAGIATPRTARALFSQGRSIPLSDLAPGDLVFFNSPDKKNRFHVGIYIGKNSFVHAPGRGRKVRQAALDTPYFRQYFLGARSFL